MRACAICESSKGSRGAGLVIAMRPSYWPQSHAGAPAFAVTPPAPGKTYVVAPPQRLLLQRDPGDLHRVRPERHVGGDELRGLRRARSQRLHAFLVEALGELRLLGGAGELGRDPRDDLVRRGGGCQQAVPALAMETGKSGF